MTDTKSSESETDSDMASAETHVLYVDADPEAAESIVSALEERVDAVSVAVATSSTEALSIVTDRPVECIVSEYALPDGTGFDLFETVRDQYDDLPFILHTAEGSEALVSDALSAGVTDYVSKRREEAVPRLASTVETILEQRHATQRITEAEADQFRTLVDDIKDHAIFLLDPEGYVSSWNSGAEHIKGYRREEILGEHFSTFYPAEAVERGKPADMLAQARAQGRAADEGWRVRKDGTRFWAKVVIAALRDDGGAVRGFAKFTRDLTEQRERERQVREQHELTERILDTVPVGVAVHTPEGDLVRANSRGHEILEVIGPRGERDDDAYATLYDGNREPLPLSEMPSARVSETGEPVSDTEIMAEQSDGTTRWLSINSVPMYEQDGDDIERIITAGQDITRVKERERQVREQHELTERILDTVPVGVAVHTPEGDLIRANQRARDILQGVETGSLEANVETGVENVYDADGEPMDQADLPPVSVFRTGEPISDTELALERSDGTLRWLSINSVPMHEQDGDRIERIITAGQDITARKEHEQELKATQRELQETVDELEEANQRLEVTQNRFEALTQNSSVGVVSIDETSTVRFANDSIEDIFGYEPDELVGESLTTVMPDRLVAQHEQALDRYIESGERRLDWEWLEIPGQHREGYEIQLGLSFGETTVGGEHLFTAVIRDITEQKEQQRELERRREELNDLVEELERSNAELEQFAYAVSHDLKEPLRMVTSYLQLLERRYGDELDEDAGEFIDFAVDGADRMKRMIDDILEFSRVGRNESAHEPVDCNVVLDEVLEMLSIEDEQGEVTVETLPTVSGNRTQLTTVFQNLISNAITHGGEGVTVRVSAERDDDEWRFSVSDTGPGIPPEEQEHVFELFNAVGTTGGTGVGLAICKKVVERHGGDIWIDSTPGEGTTFSFTLPPTEADDPAP